MGLIKVLCDVPHLSHTEQLFVFQRSFPEKFSREFAFQLCTICLKSPDVGTLQVVLGRVELRAASALHSSYSNTVALV